MRAESICWRRGRRARAGDFFITRRARVPCQTQFVFRCSTLTIWLNYLLGRAIRDALALFRPLSMASSVWLTSAFVLFASVVIIITRQPLSAHAIRLGEANSKPQLAAGSDDVKAARRVIPQSTLVITKPRERLSRRSCPSSSPHFSQSPSRFESARQTLSFFPGGASAIRVLFPRGWESFEFRYCSRYYGRRALTKRA